MTVQIKSTTAYNRYLELLSNANIPCLVSLKNDGSASVTTFSQASIDIWESVCQEIWGF